MATKTTTEAAHSADFEMLNNRYQMNWITKATLKKWVIIHQSRPTRGITAEEYEEITGEVYAE